MKTQLLQQATHLHVEARVRYWEDGRINGIEDEAGNLTPCRSGDIWRPVINLETGAISDWPPGVTADIHYKVCDAGEYWLADASGRRIAKYADHYVPDMLAVNKNGYGDYIIMSIGADGRILNWCGDIDEDDWEEVEP